MIDASSGPAVPTLCTGSRPRHSPHRTRKTPPTRRQFGQEDTRLPLPNHFFINPAVRWSQTAIPLLTRLHVIRMARHRNPRPYVDAQNRKGVGSFNLASTHTSLCESQSEPHVIWGAVIHCCEHSHGLSRGCRWVAEPGGVASSAYVNTPPVTPGLLASIGTLIVRLTCPGKFAQASMTDCKSSSTVTVSVTGGGSVFVS